MAVEAKVRLLAARLRCPLCLEPLEESPPPAAPHPESTPPDATLAPPPDPSATCPDCSTAYHAACVVELGVFCTTIGCAQGPKPPPKRGHAIGVQVRPRVGLVVPLVLTWLLYVPWPLGLIAWGWTLWRARRRRRRSAWAAAVLLSPFVVVPAWSAVAAVHGYVTGTAGLTTPGDWGHSPSTLRTELLLDPDVRCPVRERGLSLGPRLPEVTNELVLRALAWLFGPMADAYTGLLPTGGYASQLLEGDSTSVIVERQDAWAPAFTWEPDRAGRLRLNVDGQALELVVPAELYWLAVRYEPSTGGVDRAGPARVAWLDPAGLLVSVDPRTDMALVVDVPHRRAVAVVHAPVRER